MDHDAFLVWWLLGVPIVLAIVDGMLIGKNSAASYGTATGYIARTDGLAAPATVGVTAARPF